MDNSYGMLALQKANLYILQEIDRICKKYKINYTLDSGTIFIPLAVNTTIIAKIIIAIT